VRNQVRLLRTDRGLTVLKDGVRELRPAYLPDPASRTAYDPGELAQCDLGVALRE
jgi:hypothetical protein